MGGIRRLPSGSFQARIQVDGQSWAETFGTLAEARQWLLLIDAARIEGTLPSRLLVSAFVDLWVATLPRQLATSRRQDLIAFVLPTLGKRPVASVTPTDVHLLMNTVREQSCDRCCDRVLRTLDALFAAAAHDYGIIGRSPVAMPVRTGPAGGDDRLLAASSSQAAATIDAALGQLE